jgi:signal transduction histidine kinase
MSTGVPNWVPAQLLELNRSGFTEEAYFSLSYSAVEDDAGVIQGMLCVCSEVTEQVLGERRLKLQRHMAAKAGDTRSTETTCRDIAAAIADYSWDVPFALIYLRDGTENSLTLRAAVGLMPGGPLSPAIVSLEASPSVDSPWPLERAAAGETVLVEDVTRQMQFAGGPFAHPVRASLVAPIAGPSGVTPLGALVLGVNPNCALDEQYRSFFELFAGQVSVAIRNAQAYEEERSRAEALAELDRAKTAFFSNVSHEFRTPLTLLLGPLEEMLTSVVDRSSVEREHLEVAHRNALRLLRLVNTLLDFARIEAGRAQASYERADLAALTAELASNFRSACAKAGLNLVVDCPPLSQETYVDRDMWEKIVLNLLSNAVKFTFEGEITVTLRPIEGGAELSVADTGVGVPEHELPRLFERFHRIENQRGRSYEGTGIGLALVRELVALHGGTLTARSEPGRGSTFAVRVPFGKAHLPADHIETGRRLAPTRMSAEAYVEEALRWIPAEEDQAPAPAPATASHEEFDLSLHQTPAADVERPRILLADDNADMRAYVKRLLREHYEVSAVSDGEAALASARENPPDLVLLDVMMPGLDGFAVLRALRGDEATRPLPVILLSARAGEEARVEGLEAGADDYLVKPFGARELLARVDGAIRLARQRSDAGEREAQVKAEIAAAQRELLIKETMLSEINHRVKNNLQFISSLVSFTTKEVSDLRTLERLETLKARVRSLGAIHNLLYGANAATIDGGGFVMELSREIRAAYAMDKVDIVVDAEAMPLELERAIPLGLLINEALLNSFKHAFGDTKAPRIAIKLRHNGDGHANLIVADNGSGVREKRSGSSGMRLMGAFAAQLGGRFDITTDRGTQIEVNFPVRRQ